MNAVMCEWLKNCYCVNVKVNGIESLKKKTTCERVFLK